MTSPDGLIADHDIARRVPMARAHLIQKRFAIFVRSKTMALSASCLRRSGRAEPDSELPGDHGHVEIVTRGRHRRRRDIAVEFASGGDERHSGIAAVDVAVAGVAERGRRPG